MPVTDQQAAALRAQLAGDLAGHKRLLADLGARATAGVTARCSRRRSTPRSTRGSPGRAPWTR